LALSDEQKDEALQEMNEECVRELTDREEDPDDPEAWKHVRHSFQSLATMLMMKWHKFPLGTRGTAEWSDYQNKFAAFLQTKWRAALGKFKAKNRKRKASPDPVRVSPHLEARELAKIQRGAGLGDRGRGEDSAFF